MKKWAPHKRIKNENGYAETGDGMKREFFRLAGGLALAAALVSAAPCAVFAVGEEATIQPGAPLR